jgi:hypothetical protein
MIYGFITQYSIFLILIELKYELERTWNIPLNNGSGFHIWPNYTNKFPSNIRFFHAISSLNYLTKLKLITSNGCNSILLRIKTRNCNIPIGIGIKIYVVFMASR